MCKHGMNNTDTCAYCNPIPKPKNLTPKEKFEQGIERIIIKHQTRLENGEITLAELKKNLMRMPWYKSKRAKELNVGKEAANWGRFYTVEEVKYIRDKYEQIGTATPEEWAAVADELGRTLYGIETQVRFVVAEDIFEMAIQRRERLSK